MAAGIQSLLALGKEQALAQNIARACKALRPEPVVIFERSMSVAISLAWSQKPSVVLVDWAAFEPEEITQFLQKLRKLKESKTLPLVILAQEVSLQCLAVSVEYESWQVLLASSLQSRLAGLLEEISHELLSPSNLRCRLVALEQASQGRSQESIDHAVEALYAQFPEVPKAMLEFANLCLRKGDLQKAEALGLRLAFGEAAKGRGTSAKSLKDLRAVNLLSRIRLKQGKFSEAVALLEQAELLSPRGLERLVMLGESYRHLGDSKKARLSLFKALEQEPENDQAKINMGLIDLSEGQINQALALFRDTASEEEVAGFFNNAGIVAIHRGEFSKAIGLYEAAHDALRSNALKAKIQFNVGLAFEKWNKNDKARQHFKNALTLDPSLVKAKRHLEPTPQQGSLTEVPAQAPEVPSQAGKKGGNGAGADANSSDLKQPMFAAISSSAEVETEPFSEVSIGEVGESDVSGSNEGDSNTGDSALEGGAAGSKNNPK